jgi:hypothetical protein
VTCVGGNSRVSDAHFSNLPGSHLDSVTMSLTCWWGGHPCKQLWACMTKWVSGAIKFSVRGVMLETQLPEGPGPLW